MKGYTEWLRNLHSETAGKCDLVAHFFRRAFDLLRPDGAFGLIATNTIGQGDTRSSGLRWICTHGGVIYWARKRYKWPGAAAVVVSVVHVHKAAVGAGFSPRPEPPENRGLKPAPTRFELDGRPVEKITAYLFHAGGHDDPKPLKANAGKSFQGSIVLGMGFTFDDTDSKGVASPLSEMRRLIDKDPRNAERIFPYIGGEEVNDSPTHAHHRYVIHFADFPLRREDLGKTWAGADDKQRESWLRTGIVPLDYPEPVAADWPDLLEIVEGKVRPERITSAQRSKSAHGGRAATWWQHYHQGKELYAAIAELERVLVINCGATPHMAFAYLGSKHVFANTLAVVSIDEIYAFTVLQSRIHEAWARFFGSSMKDDLRYTPSDCFETFPFPPAVGANSFAHSTPETGRINSPLHTAGRDYYDFRAELMARNGEGLTRTYNRFHDPNEISPDIQRLRELHARMDRAVLAAYGWDDIPTDCVFLLDFEDEDGEATLTPNPSPVRGGRGGRKKPWRYRWPDEVRDEVLARLLALNAERAAGEERAGTLATAGEQKAGKPAVRKGRKPKGGDENLTLDF